MPRSRGRSGSGHRAPAAAPRPPPPAPVQSRNNGSILGRLAEGMAFSTGSAIARRVVDAIMGPTVVRHETVASTSRSDASLPSSSTAGAQVCNGQSKALQYCLNNYGSDISKCQFYMDMLEECRRKEGVSFN
ncbi:hemiasterlin resistant protein 1-like [Senna tora]|uniref:Hemiasterlin resistant protein 1-like n=1 Tax=Senna tora TaxID=362788 RepID=A0A834TWP1_9FABA|nr:hemiasterlin resistant protein 1-like [Senna tora]